MRKLWTEKEDGVLRERYADTENAVLARDLGFSQRTVARHAAELGLRKSADLMERTQRRASAEGMMALEYMRITGQKVKKKSAPGRPFPKGHHWDPETEKKRVEALRERAWQERRRLMHGMRRTTGWKMVDDLEKIK